MVHMASVGPSFCPELPLLFHWALTTSDWAVPPPRPGVRQPMAVVLQSEINNTHRYYATILITFISVSVWQGWGNWKWTIYYKFDFNFISDTETPRSINHDMERTGSLPELLMDVLEFCNEKDIEMIMESPDVSKNCKDLLSDRSRFEKWHIEALDKKSNPMERWQFFSNSWTKSILINIWKVIGKL